MRYKFFLLFCFFSFCFQHSEAQEQRFSAGLIFGGNLSQIDGDLSAGYIKLGITGGLRGVAMINDKVDLSIELLFDQRGSKSQPVFDENFFPFRITNNYVSIPVLINYQDWLDDSEDFYKMHFHGGFSYGRLLNTDIKDEDENSILVPISESFNKNDIALVAGVTFFATQNIAVTGRFSYSVTKLYKNGDGTINVQLPFRAKQLTLQALYMF